MDAGREKNAGARDEDDPAEEGVEGGEDFGGGIREVGAVNGAFAAHEHGGFEKGIEPAEAADEPVAKNAEGQGEGDEGQGDEEVIGHAPEEDVVRGDRLAMVLERHLSVVHSWPMMKRAVSSVVRKINQKLGENLICRLQTTGYRGHRSSIYQSPSSFPARRAGKVGGAGFEPAKA